MEDRVAAYHHVAEKLPPHNMVWPTYGAGFENFGKDSQPIETPMPEIGPDELLVRHDACGLCFSDIKITRTSQVVGGDRQKYVMEFDLKCPEDQKSVAGKKPSGASSSSPAGSASAGGGK